MGTINSALNPIPYLASGWLGFFSFSSISFSRLVVSTGLAPPKMDDWCTGAAATAAAGAGG